MHKYLNDAVNKVGFFSVLDDVYSVQESVFEEISETIIKLCLDCYLARSRRACRAGLRRGRAQNAVFALRRELKAVYGIMLRLKRTGKQKYIKHYVLILPKKLMELANRSNFFEKTKYQPLHKVNSDQTASLFGNKNLTPLQQVTENIRYPENKGVVTVMGVQYNRVDYGGQGNCLFLAVAGGLRFFFGPSKYDHRYLRQAVADWYIQFGLQFRALIGARPSDVIFDSPDLPKKNVFKNWTWAQWGHHISKIGVWGGDSEVMAFNMILPESYKLNIYKSNDGVICGNEHNKQTDTIILVHHRGSHYTSLQPLN